jgi:excisionase family DNA binding protein
MTPCAPGELEGLPRNLKIAEFAAEVRRTDRTVRRWIASGLVKAVRPCGGLPLIPRSELQRILTEGAS